MSDTGQPMGGVIEPRSVKNPDAEGPPKNPKVEMDPVKVRSVKNPESEKLEKNPPKPQGMNNPMEVRAVRNEEKPEQGRSTKYQVNEGWQVKHEGKVLHGGDRFDASSSRGEVRRWERAGWVSKAESKPKKSEAPKAEADPDPNPKPVSSTPKTTVRR